MGLIETFIAMDTSEVIDLLFKVLLVSLMISLIISPFKKVIKGNKKSFEINYDKDDEEDEEEVRNPELELQEVRDMSKLLHQLINRECTLIGEDEDTEGTIVSVEESLVKVRTINKKGETKLEIIKISTIEKIEVIENN